MLPPMPLEPRLECGILGTVLAGVLNLVFRRAQFRGHQFAAALLLSPLAIVVASEAGLSSGDRTEYVFLGALVGITFVRGSRAPGPLSDYRVRVRGVLIAAVVLGPVMGLVAHYIRYRAGRVGLFDSWEIELSLVDGGIASCAGGLLMVIMAVGSRGLAPCTSPAAIQPGKLVV